MFVTHREHRLLVRAPLGFSQKIRKFLLSSQDKCLSQKYGKNRRNVYSNVNKNPTGRNFGWKRTQHRSLDRVNFIELILPCIPLILEQRLGAHEMIAIYSHSGIPTAVSYRQVNTGVLFEPNSENLVIRTIPHIGVSTRPATICRIVIMFPPAYHASDLYQIADWQKNIFYGAHFT
ncbi:hypothetical protein C8R31_10535 [Nitrosospira sp. Nsp2]|uniref:hypothetical protein n=1 Tax=Nitrosospira sp. Nsp2 TaxID=136548 RepID=UPI000D40EE88|nr:hypothetical protein [Nitrosospira sp. Nsp2]PTR14679.1 hypothetical protein C8R31_10535 [Nitrosospira sp. Nsp2]